MNVLDVRAVTKSWPGAPTPVLNSIELSVPAGSLVVIDGANGAGKTTLLRVVAGLIAPDQGEVHVCGLSPTHERVMYQRSLGVAPAGHGGLYARLSARAHLRFSARLQLVARTRRRRVVDDAIESFELGPFADRRVDRLSMGQRQRLRLALAFLHEPSVVLLDEPSNSLDETGLTILERGLGEHLGGGGSAVWFLPSGGALPATPQLRLTLDNGALVAR